MDLKLNCIFCGRPADTREHIPAKQFFKGVPDRNLITVPSCLKCNRSFQKDEDFFRQFNVGFLSDRSAEAKKFLENEVTRSIMRRPALAKQMFNQMKLVDAYTKAERKYVGKRTVYQLSTSDISRINRVVRKIIDGLFFHHFNKVVPKRWEVNIVWINPKNQKELDLENVEKTLRWHIIKEDVFAYGVEFVPETFQSIWILDFFKVPLFYVLVLDRKTAKKDGK